MALARPEPTRRSLVLNFVGFQATWWALILGAANGLWLAGVGFAFGWFLLHLRSQGSVWPVDLKLGVAAVLMGAVLDSSLVLLGLLEFPAAASVGPLTPPWMLALWVAFAFTLGHSLSWLAGRYLLATLVGAICGPLAYTGGQAMGAVLLIQPVGSWLAVGAIYAFATPALLMLRERFEATAARNALIPQGAEV
jgi:hypothetical protein